MIFCVGAFLYSRNNLWTELFFSKVLDSPSPAVDNAMGKTSTLPILTHCVVQRQRNLHCVETRHKTIWQFFYFSDHSVSGTVAMLRLLAKETLKVAWIPSSPTRALATAAPAPSITQIYCQHICSLLSPQDWIEVRRFEKELGKTKYTKV